MDEKDKNFVFCCSGPKMPTIVNSTYRYSKEEYLRRVYRDVIHIIKTGGDKENELEDLIDKSTLEGKNTHMWQWKSDFGYVLIMMDNMNTKETLQLKWKFSKMCGCQL